jgi:hypothetical protein
MSDWLFDPLMPVIVILAYPVYVLLMAAVLRICGVSPEDVAKWALKQADRHRVVELIRVAQRRRVPVPRGGASGQPADGRPDQ